MASCIALLFIVGFVAVHIVLLTLLRGWVLSSLWSWFIVPTFGLPELTIAPAIGLALVVSFLTHQIDMDKKESAENSGWKITVPYFAPLVVLLFGWVVKHWM